MESFLIAEAQLPSPHVYVYRTVDGVAIEADVFLPATEFSKSQCPLFLFIHGGGWMAGTRKDVNGPMLHEFLQRGFVVTSIDYRLFLEITMQEQLDDIRKVEDWARVDLPAEAKQLGFELMPDKVIVGGSSAGGHLALMVVRPSPPPLNCFLGNGYLTKTAASSLATATTCITRALLADRPHHDQTT